MRCVVLMTLGLSLYATAALAADGQQLLQSHCVSCHALVRPAEFSVQRLWERKGPDLYYAGSKFNKAWLVQWLQAPRRLRPAGELYAKHIKPGAERDVIDETTLTPHGKLSQADAESVAEALMALSGPPGLVEKGAFKNEPVNATLGGLFFTKLRGCASCH